MIPKIAHPTYEIIQPSTGKKIKFRPYLVKEEKILLMAKQTRNIADAYRAIQSILSACAVTPIDVDLLPLFDSEIMYLHLRGLSVNNVEKLKIEDPADHHIYDLTINFDEIKVKWPEPLPSKKIQIKGQKNKDIVILLKYPEAMKVYSEDNDEIVKNLTANIFKFISCVIDKVYVGDTVCEMTEEELKEFVDNLDHNSFKQIENFIINLPSVEYVISYDKKNGEKVDLTFRSLMDFFIFL